MNSSKVVLAVLLVSSSYLCAEKGKDEHLSEIEIRKARDRKYDEELWGSEAATPVSPQVIEKMVKELKKKRASDSSEISK